MRFLQIALLSCFLAIFGQAATIYDSIAGPLPPSSTSLGYQATSTAEFGNLIQFSGVERALTTVDVVMTNWAYQSKPESAGHGDATGYTHTLTLNLYSVGPDNSVGSLISTQTISPHILWRPEPSIGCTDNRYMSGDTCYSGQNQVVTFDFTSLGITLPDQIIFGLAFNTETHGYNPIGQSGPYNSLNFGLLTTTPSVGSNPVPGTLYWNTSHGPFYDDNGAGGVGVFRADTGWSPYSPQIQFNAEAPVPEPGTWFLSSLGLGMIIFFRRRLLPKMGR